MRGEKQPQAAASGRAFPPLDTGSPSALQCAAPDCAFSVGKSHLCLPTAILPCLRVPGKRARAHRLILEEAQSSIHRLGERLAISTSPRRKQIAIQPCACRAVLSTRCRR
jgi:hypothetical protein